MHIDQLDLQVGDVFTRGLALSRSVSGRELTALVASGAITRLGPGVYRAGQLDGPDPRGMSMALRAVLSHQTAASWLGADLPFAAGCVHLTASRSRGRRADDVPGVRLHRARLLASDVMTVCEAKVTSATRTILDVARSASLVEAVAIADSLCHQGIARVADVQQAAAGLAPGPGRPAAIRAAALLDPRAESVFESISRVQLVTTGLPVPVSQLEVLDRAGSWIARVDFAWPLQRLILECDGFEFHGNREQFERDRRRWSALTRAGWRVVVVTWRDVLGDPAYLVGLIADLLR